MEAAETLLIVGTGHAGVELGFAARQAGWSGAIVLLGDEQQLPYHRPPLSKHYLDGSASADSLALKSVAAYEAAGIQLRLGARVAYIDRARRELALTDGRSLSWTKLALCTGGRPRPLALPGQDPATAVAPANLHYLRTRDDADRIRAALRPGARLVIVGGGYVGLEVAASATGLGATTTLLEMQPRVLSRVTGEELSRFYEQVHRDAGVDIRTGVAIEAIELAPDGSIRALECSDGRRVEVDLLMAGVGMVPNVELALAAGLEVDAGIAVDEHSRTSDPDIFAAGDCTVQDDALHTGRVRLESVPNALEQARAAAATLGGSPKPNRSVPWFWSDQYDLKLQMAGLSAGHERCIVRGSVEARSFAAFYLRGDRLLAVDAVNRPADFMAGKRGLGAAIGNIDALADEAAPLRQVLAAAA